MSTYILSALLSLPLKIFEIREPREDGPGAEVWWHCGATSDRRWHRPVQQAALSAQAEHHGSHCECSQAATGSAACNIGHFMVFLCYTTKNKQLLLRKDGCSAVVPGHGNWCVPRQDAVCTLLPWVIIDLTLSSCVSISFLSSWCGLYKAHCLLRFL